MCEIALGTSVPGGKREEEGALCLEQRDFLAAHGGSIKEQILHCTHDRDFVVVTGK